MMNVISPVWIRPLRMRQMPRAIPAATMDGATPLMIPVLPMLVVRGPFNLTCGESASDRAGKVGMKVTGSTLRSQGSMAVTYKPLIRRGDWRDVWAP